MRLSTIMFTFSLLLSFASQANNELTNFIDSIGDESWSISLDNPQQAIELSLIALHLSDSIGYLKGQQYNHSCLGTYYSESNSFIAAERHLKAAIGIRIQNDDKKGIAGDYARLCALKKTEGDYLEAITYGMKALEIFNQLDLAPPQQSTILEHMAMSYAANRDTVDARHYYQKALSSLSTKDQLKKRVFTLFNKAFFHYEIAELDSAQILIEQALEIVNRQDQKTLLGSLYDLLGVVYIGLQDFEKAYIELQKSLLIHRDLADTFRVFENHLSLATLFYEENRLTQALQYCDSATLDMQTFDKVSSREKLFRLYSNVYEKMDKPTKAFHYFIQAEAAEDSIFNKEKQESIQRIRRVYAERDAARKGEQVAEVSAKNYRLGISVFVISFLGLIVAFSLNRGRVKKARELIEYKQIQEKVTAKRVINGNKKTRQDLSVKLHDHVSRPLTHIKRLLETIHQELAFDEYLVSQIQHATKIADSTYTVSRDISYELRPDTIDWMDDIKLSLSGIKSIKPSLKVSSLKEDDFTKEKGRKISAIIGNILSNIEKHAQAENVNVIITKKDSQLNIFVEDDGIGFEPNTTKGVGLESIQLYVAELNGEIDLKSAPHQGTKFRIKIPMS